MEVTNLLFRQYFLVHERLLNKNKIISIKTAQICAVFLSLAKLTSYQYDLAFYINISTNMPRDFFYCVVCEYDVIGVAWQNSALPVRVQVPLLAS